MERKRHAAALPGADHHAPPLTAWLTVLRRARYRAPCQSLVQHNPQAAVSALLFCFIFFFVNSRDVGRRCVQLVVERRGQKPRKPMGSIFGTWQTDLATFFRLCIHIPRAILTEGRTCLRVASALFSRCYVDTRH